MLTTYDIFDDVLRLRDVVDTFFKDVPTTGRRVHDYPYVNIHEENDHLKLMALLPGVGKDELKIELNDNGLTIEGERKSDIKDKPYLRKERTFGKFSKLIRLPYPVNRDSISASLKNGILTISLEKSDEAKPKRIEVS